MDLWDRLEHTLEEYIGMLPPPQTPHQKLAKRRVNEVLIECRKAAEGLVLEAKKQHANLAILMENELYSHMIRGPQDAPFRMVETLEAIDIGLNNDNPAIERRLPAPFVATLKGAFF